MLQTSHVAQACRATRDNKSDRYNNFINCRAERIVAKIIPSNYQGLAKRLA